MSTVAPADVQELSAYTRLVADRAKRASRELVSISGEQKSAWLAEVAKRLRGNSEAIVTGNARDLEAADESGLSSAMIDRLRLNEERLEKIAKAVEEIIALPDPLGRVRGGEVRPNGLVIRKVSVPLGVVFFIYESRPNVTIDAAALCVKSGNAVILRGGKEALHSNLALYELLQESLRATGLPEHAVQLVETTDRAAVGHFLKMNDAIDVAIPRGGKGLIERVTAEATMPVIKHFDGICHVYLDASADPEMATAITVNSKCHRTGVCNAAETLLVHANAAKTLLPDVLSALKKQGVELRGCDRTRAVDADVKPATEEDFHTEYLDLILSVKIVDSLTDAIEHINEYGSGHTDTIVTSDLEASRLFTLGVDSSAVMVNASTRFNDGGEFGLGAEIGISTDKFHARGPCGLEELTSYKYIVHGTGQIRT